MEYMELEDRSPTLNRILYTNISSLLTSWLESSKFWLCFSIVSGAIFTIVSLMILVLRKRIVLAIALIEESSKYVNFEHIIQKLTRFFVNLHVKGC